MLRELVGVRGGDLELLGALRDLVLQRALVVRHFRLRLGEPLRHVVERVRQQAQLVRGRGRDVHVEAARADRARRPHEPAHRRHQPAGEQQRRDDGHDGEQKDDRERSQDAGHHLVALALVGHAQAQVADRGRGSGLAGLLPAAPASARPCSPAARPDGGKELEVAAPGDRLLDLQHLAGLRRAELRRQRRDRMVADRGAEAAFRHGLELGVEDGRIGHVAVHGEPLQQEVDRAAVGGVDPELGGAAQDADQRGAALAQLASSLPHCSQK